MSDNQEPPSDDFKTGVKEIEKLFDEYPIFWDQMNKDKTSLYSSKYLFIHEKRAGQLPTIGCIRAILFGQWKGFEIILQDSKPEKLGTFKELESIILEPSNNLMFPYVDQDSERLKAFQMTIFKYFKCDKKRYTNQYTKNKLAFGLANHPWFSNAGADKTKDFNPAGLGMPSFNIGSYK